MTEKRTTDNVDGRHKAHQEDRTWGGQGAQPGAAPTLVMSAEKLAAVTMTTDTGSEWRETGEEWESLGPAKVSHGQAGEYPDVHVSGRVNALAVCGETVYAATSNGGLWKSADQGDTWDTTMCARPNRPLEGPSLDEDPEYFNADSLACGAVAAIGQRLYVGTGEGYGFSDSYYGIGALSSDDGGDSWRREPAAEGEDSPALEGQGFYRIAAARAAGVATTAGNERPADVVFAATNKGLYERKESGGKGRWARHVLAPAKPDEKATDVVVSSVVKEKKVTRNVFYAALNNDHVYRWNGGWEKDPVGGEFPVRDGRISLAVKADNPDVLYALTESGRVFRLAAGTDAKWQKVTGLPKPDGEWNANGYFNLAIALDPQSPGDGKERIYFGMARARAAADSDWHGALFSCDVTLTPGVDPATPGVDPALVAKPIGASLHPDIHALELDQQSNLWVGCDGGVFRSDKPPSGDGFKRFKARNDGLQTLSLQGFGQHPTKRNVLFCGCQDNGCLEYEGGKTWKEIHANDAGAVLVNTEGRSTQVLVSATEEMIFKTTVTDKDPVWGEVSLKLEKYMDNATFGLRPENIEFYPPLASAPDDASLVACGAESVRINRRFGTGKWEKLSDHLKEDGSEWIRSLQFFDSNKLYAGTKIQESNAGETTFRGAVLRYVCDSSGRWSGQRLLPELPAPVTGIAIDPADASGDSVYVTLGGDHELPRVRHYCPKKKWTVRSGEEPKPLFDLDLVPMAAPQKPSEVADLDSGRIPESLRARFESLGPDVPALHEDAVVSVVVKGFRWHILEPRGGRHLDLRADLRKLQGDPAADEEVGTHDRWVGKLVVLEETHRLLRVHHSAIVADPDDHGVLYAAADIGVWRSRDAGSTWCPFSRLLPDAAVLDLKIFSPRRGKRRLRAATHGRGLFETVLPRKVVDVLCVVDGRTLLEERPKAGPKNCRMVTRGEHCIVNNNGEPVLRVQANDQVRWRAVSLTADEEFDVEISNLEFVDPSQALDFCRKPGRGPCEKDLWEARTLAHGQAAYDLELSIRGNGVNGKFKWRAQLMVDPEGPAPHPQAEEEVPEMGNDRKIDILCVVDGKTLFEKYPKATCRDSKQLLNADNRIQQYCRMITRNSDRVGFNAHHNLEIQAWPGEEIRWRAVSLTGDSEYKVAIEDFYSVDDTLYTTPVPDPPGKDVYLSKALPIQESTRSDNYYLIFTVEHGGEKRWFDWDPIITVKKK